MSKTDKKDKIVKKDKTVKNDKRTIKTEKQALEEPLGTFHHPTKNTYRTGACNIGEILKKGYTKKTKSNKNIYIGPVCIKDKGNPGIDINTKSELKIEENKKMQIYINKINNNSFKSVIMSLYPQLKKKDITYTQKKDITKDIEMLTKWRVNNPNKNKNKNKPSNKILNVTNITQPIIKKNNSNNSGKLFNSSIKEFSNNLSTDFLPVEKKMDSKKNITDVNSRKNITSVNIKKNITSVNIKKNKKTTNKNNNIQQLSTSEIIELIKNA